MKSRRYSTSLPVDDIRRYLFHSLTPNKIDGARENPNSHWERRPKLLFVATLIPFFLFFSILLACGIRNFKFIGD